MNIDLIQVNECDKLVGFVLEIKNSYFLPVTLSYTGADLIVDILDHKGFKLHKATFVDEKLHDDEEGNVHVSRFPSGVSKLSVSMNESSQYYQTLVLPDLINRNYNFYAKAFGLAVQPIYSYYIDTKKTNKMC